MESLVSFSLKQKIFFNLVFVLLSVSGAVALMELPTERYPNVNFGEVTISTYYPGASATEVETLVTKKLEDAIDEVEDIEWINATSYPERSSIRLKFLDDKDYRFLYNEVRLRVLNIKSELPAEVDPPVMNNATIDDYLPVIDINLGGGHGNRALSLIAKELKNSILNIDGVKEARISGEFIPEYHILLDLNKLKLFGVSFDEVSGVLQAVNVAVPAGNFKTKTGKYLIKVDEKFHDRSQIINTIIRRDRDGGFVRLEDLISDVKLSYRDPIAISSVNGKNVVSIEVIKSENGNALDIKKNINKVLGGFNSLFEKENIDITYTRDSTVKIKDGISTLGMNMIAGIILVSLIIWYFMGLRNSALVSLGIPFSFMISMLLMHLSGHSLNEMTLFSFVLVSGIIVDDAIVVTENIYRHIQEGMELEGAIVKGTSEVALPVISSTLTTIAAFLPMLIMSGSTGEFFAQIPIAVTFALTASLFECLLILPIHYLDYGPRSSDMLSTRLKKDDFMLSFLRGLTQRVLGYTLKHRYVSIFSVLSLLILSLTIFFISANGVLPLLKIKFFPDDYTVYYADIKGPPDTPIEKTDQIIKKITNVILNGGSGEVKSAAGFAGWYPNEEYEPVFGNNHGTVIVTLPSKDERTFSDPLKHLEKIRNKLTSTFERDGYLLNVHAQKEGPRTGKDINVRIIGSNLSAISDLADKIHDFLLTDSEIAPFLVEFEDDRGLSKQLYRFEVQHEKVSEYGLNIGAVALLAGSVFDGRYIGKYRLNDEEIDLKLLIDPYGIEIPEQILQIPLIERTPNPILLSDVTVLRTYKEQDQLHRYDGLRAVSLKANLKSDAPTSVPVINNSIERFYSKIKATYPGASVVFGGEHDSTQRSYQSLVYAFIIGIIIIYMILAAQFQSYMQPAIILSAIAFALIGVILGKLVTQSLVTVNSFMAIIGVAGVVVNDSLMLIDFINNGYRSGMSRREAIDHGIKLRLRPIFLTTLTTALGLLPMALGIPDYSLVWGAMASTFVTGLATATLLTLFIVPVLWDMVMDSKEKRLAVNHLYSKRHF